MEMEVLSKMETTTINKDNNLSISASDIQSTIISDTLNNITCEIDWRVPVNYIKLTEDAIEPTQGSAEAAGYDLYIPSSIEEIVIPAHETIKVGTGIAIELPNSTFGGIFARSGLATKQGLRPANCVGVIDSDYRGEIIVAIHNDTDDKKILHGGDRIAQLVILPYIQFKLEEVSELSSTNRGEGGFGSTGK